MKAVSSKRFARRNACFTGYLHTEWFQLSVPNHPTNVVLRVPSITPLPEAGGENPLSLESITHDTLNQDVDLTRTYLVTRRLPNGQLRYNCPYMSTNVVPQSLARLVVDIRTDVEPNVS